MHLTLPVSTLDVGTVVKEEAFAIGNMAVIMELLRSKMYSNPIRTIIQEISSNARDANREVGKPNEPIYIKLPTRADTELHIRDSGPGISPERMSGVYLQYGNSTKRDNELETGRFGLGAKSPFAYTSTFGIETVTPEDGKNICRHYVATIDQSRIGKVLLCSTKETTDPCGTTIKIPVKPQDIGEFARWTNIMLGRWNPLPKINLPAEEVFTAIPKPDVQGDDWELIMDKRVEKGVFYYEDLIPYQVKDTNFEDIPSNLQTLFNHVRVNMFGKGKVEVTGNRESIDYLPHVQAFLMEKLQSIYNEMNKRLSEMVANCPNMWDALCIAGRYKEEFHTNLLRDVVWKGKKLPVFDTVSFEYANVYEVDKDSSNVYGVSIKRKNWGFTPRKSVFLLENPSSGRPNAAFLQEAYKFAEAHYLTAGIQNWSFYVVSWRTNDDANVAAEKLKYCWLDWNVRSLKDFKPPHIHNADGTRKYRVVKVREYVQNEESYSKRWPEADVDIDADGGVYVVLHEREPVGCSNWDIHNFVDLTGEKVYGIPRRFAFKGEEIRLGSNWTPFKQAVKNAFEDTVLEKGKVVISAEAMEYMPRNTINGELKKHIEDLVEQKQINGKIAKWFNYGKIAATQNNSKLLGLANLAGRAKELVMDETPIRLAKEIWKSFPMLFTFDGLRYGLGNKFKAQWKQVLLMYVQYIKMVEESEKEVIYKAMAEANAENAERSTPILAVQESSPAVKEEVKMVRFGILKS
jgi:hypothetical protein